MDTQRLKELGLTTTRINDEQSLRAALSSGLNELYQQVFAGPPYNEVFSTSEVDEIFTSYFQGGGEIFIATNSSNSPIAFVAAIPLKSDFNLTAIVKKHVNVKRTAYFAEDGVDNTLRQKGISAEMKALLLAACDKKGFKTLLLRTSIYNYKQISAVNKAGGCVIKGLFQEVTSTRSDRTMIQDARSFYKFDLTPAMLADTLTLERVTIVRPGGNDTAIVWDNIPRDQQGPLSKKIQATYPGIEQVMFVEQGQNGLIRGQMAGGEFCGNATRSLGYLIVQGENGEVTLEISGAQRPLSVVVQDGMAQTSLPVKEDLNSAQPFGEDYIVHLDGISFIITSRNNSLGSQIMSETDADRQKSIVLNALKTNGFADQYPASGVMIIDKQSDTTFKLEPFVYVRDTGTLYYESGCGSGSTSVGVMVAKEMGGPVKDLKITQPSGVDLLVSIDRNSCEFKGATVNGPIEVLFDGRMYISALKVDMERFLMMSPHI